MEPVGMNRSDSSGEEYFSADDEENIRLESGCVVVETGGLRHGPDVCTTGAKRYNSLFLISIFFGT